MISLRFLLLNRVLSVLSRTDGLQCFHWTVEHLLIKSVNCNGWTMLG